MKRFETLLEVIKNQAGLVGLVGVDDDATAVAYDVLLERCSPIKPYVYEWFVVVRNDGQVRAWLKGRRGLDRVTSVFRELRLGEAGEWASLSVGMFKELERAMGLT